MRRVISKFKGNVALLLIIIVFLVVIFTEEGGANIVNIVASIIAFIISLYITIYIHELGRAFAGRSVNFTIKRIIIGTGRAMIKTRIRGVLLIITTNFRGGGTYVGNVPHTYLKLRCLVFVLGGLIAQGLASGISLFLLNMLRRKGFTPAQLFIGYMFLYANLITIGWKLIPRKLDMGGVAIPNDSLMILKLPFLTGQEIQRILCAGNSMMDAHDLYEARRFHEAEIAFRECIELYPDVLLLKLRLATALIEQGKLNEAQTFLETFLETFYDDPNAFALYHTLAWLSFLQFTPDSLRKADEYSQQAVKWGSQQSSLLGMRGCILIEKGELDEGIQLLKPLVNLHQPLNERTNPHLLCLYLAYGYYLKHDLDNGLQYITKLDEYHEPFDKDYQVILDRIMEKTGNFNNILHSSVDTFRKR